MTARLFATLAAASLFAACNSSGGGQPLTPMPHPSTPAEQPSALAKAAPAAGSTPAATAEAKEIFTTRCTACHGLTGGGDGAAAAALTPKPRNFHDAAWQGKVTDEHLEKIILEGGPAVGLSPLMPPNPDLASKHATVVALREYIRGLKQ
jgi:mono/diheme cytochrome c family protein